MAAFLSPFLMVTIYAGVSTYFGFLEHTQLDLTILLAGLSAGCLCAVQGLRQPGGLWIKEFFIVAPVYVLAYGPFLYATLHVVSFLGAFFFELPIAP